MRIIEYGRGDVFTLSSSLRFLVIYLLCVCFVLLGWATYAYFRMLEESQGAVETSNGENANANNTCNAEVQIGSQPNHRNNNTFTGISLSGDSGPTAEDLESGRR